MPVPAFPRLGALARSPCKSRQEPIHLGARLARFSYTLLEAFNYRARRGPSAMRLATPSLVGGNGVRYPFRGQGLRMVFSNPNFATAFDTEGSEPYGLLRSEERRVGKECRS